MISPDLRATLRLAFVEARESRHETLSVEHLLLALLRNPRAVEVLRACSMDVEQAHRSLSTIVRDKTPVAAGAGPVEPRASVEFQRVSDPPEMRGSS